MRRHNFGRILWVSSLFLLLITILLMVMDYKINYQYLEEKNLYFYECDGTLCVSEMKDETSLVYSKYHCQGECPYYQKNLDDNYVLLSQKNSSKLILWNFRSGEEISNQYDDYTLLDTNHFIVTQGKKRGVIDKKNRIIIPISYDEIGIYKDNLLTGYNFENIIVKNDNKYGIISYQNGNIIEQLEYEENSLAALIEKLKNGE